MKPLTVNIPDPYMERIEFLIDRKLYPNKAEAIRTAIRDFIKNELTRIQQETP